jgi:Cdc6-like AAA superfamily ATPase
MKEFFENLVDTKYELSASSTNNPTTSVLLKLVQSKDELQTKFIETIVSRMQTILIEPDQVVVQN